MKLHDYQLRGLQHLQANPRAALFWDVGTGKTAVTLSALTPEHLPALVCAPRRVVEHTWPAEVAKWRPDLSIALAIGTPSQRKAAFDARADLTIVGRDVLSDAPIDRYRTLVLDESHGFRGNTNRFKAARALVRTIPHVWELTGTPAPRSLEDVFRQVYLLDGGERLGKTLTGFRRRYFRPGRVINGHVVVEWLLREDAETAIHELLADICLSQAALEHLMPKVSFNQITVELPAEQRKQYRTLVRDLVVYLDMLGVVSAANAAVVTSKLSQLTAGFLYDEDRNALWLHNEKLDALEALAEEQGTPVLVAYRFKAELAALQRRFPQAKTLDDRGVMEGWNRGDVPILLAQPQSAGAGLNLQAGHVLAWTTPTWDLEQRIQMNGRIARQGQQHPVVIHDIVVPGTVDITILDRLAGKELTQDSLLEALRQQA